MAEITLQAETGRPTGSRVSKRLLASGRVPGVVYGLGNDPTPVSVDWRELRTVLTTDAGLNALIDLSIDGETKLSIVKDLQRDPIKHTVKHVDFLLIRRDQAITVDVPIVLEGEAHDVEREDGLVDHSLVTLTVSAKPADIPNEITVDISALQIGDVIRVGDLALPSGVTTDLDPEDPVVSAHSTRAEAEEPAEVEGEAAEGAEAEGGDAAEGGSGEAEAGDEG
jgi:large subunit ribosomal protein L25